MAGLHELKPASGAKRSRKRVGRGDGSGSGTYSGRGSKGQKQRGKVHYLFEGGQLPLVKRLPFMRGFRNRNRIEYKPINIERLSEIFEDGIEITPELLLERRILKNKQDLVKILGAGELSKKFKISAHAFSKTAKGKIEKAGGVVNVIKPEKIGASK